MHFGDTLETDSNFQKCWSNLSQPLYIYAYMHVHINMCTHIHSLTHERIHKQSLSLHLSFVSDPQIMHNHQHDNQKECKKKGACDFLTESIVCTDLQYMIQFTSKHQRKNPTCHRFITSIADKVTTYFYTSKILT